MRRSSIAVSTLSAAVVEITTGGSIFKVSIPASAIANAMLSKFMSVITVVLDASGTVTAVATSIPSARRRRPVDLLVTDNMTMSATLTRSAVAKPCKNAALIESLKSSTDTATASFNSIFFRCTDVGVLGGLVICFRVIQLVAISC